MSGAGLIRRSEVVGWMIVCLLAAILVLAVLTRVAGANSVEPLPKSDGSYIVSPLTGTFVAGEYPGAEPYVAVGTEIEPGSIVGNVEFRGRLHPVEATVSGKIIEVLYTDDAMVVTGQVLFKVQVKAETPAV